MKNDCMIECAGVGGCVCGCADWPACAAHPDELVRAGESGKLFW